MTNKGTHYIRKFTWIGSYFVNNLLRRRRLLLLSNLWTHFCASLCSYVLNLIHKNGLYQFVLFGNVPPFPSPTLLQVIRDAPRGTWPL